MIEEQGDSEAQEVDKAGQGTPWLKKKAQQGKVGGKKS